MNNETLERIKKSMLNKENTDVMDAIISETIDLLNARIKLFESPAKRVGALLNILINVTGMSIISMANDNKRKDAFQEYANHLLFWLTEFEKKASSKEDDK